MSRGDLRTHHVATWEEGRKALFYCLSSFKIRVIDKAKQNKTKQNKINFLFEIMTYVKWTNKTK